MAGADSSVTPINLTRVFEMEALARMGSEPVRVHADCLPHPFEMEALARLGSEPVRVHADCLPHPFEMEALALGWARSR